MKPVVSTYFWTRGVSRRMKEKKDKRKESDRKSDPYSVRIKAADFCFHLFMYFCSKKISTFETFNIYSILFTVSKQK